MPQAQAALLEANADENNYPSRGPRFSRSPHPYSKVKSDVLQDSNAAACLGNALVSPTVTDSSVTSEKNLYTYFDADHRKRRKGYSSPSDSGTEADDERGRSSLLGLPAPPIRPRKGLKGSKGSGTESPLLTPSYLDAESRRLDSKAEVKRRGSLQSQSCTDEETVKLRQKFNQRRRAELIRRVSETILMGAIGFIACSTDIGWLLRLWAGGYLHSSFLASDIRLGHVPIALLSHTVVVLGLYALYPIRIIYKDHTLSAAKQRSRFYIHIPAAFDPAPLLYPILIPVFVALSLINVDPRPLLPNLVLSISSIPSKIIPFGNDLPWYSSWQWILSIMPVLASQIWFMNNSQAPMRLEGSVPDSLSAEVLVLLYPLHQALLPTLGYLTTTSLLPAELQLLSASMINLLINSTSPQAYILQSLMWIGGLSVFILCGKVLSWGVALARVPSWRFRQPRNHTRRNKGAAYAMDEYLNGKLSNWGLVAVDSEASEDEEPQRRLKSHARKRSMQVLSPHTCGNEPTEGGSSAQYALDMPISALKDHKQPEIPGVIRTTKSPQNAMGRQRRYTLPSYFGSLPGKPSKDSLKRGRRSPLSSAKPWSFRSLTKGQANVVKWLFTLYVYVVVIAVIAFTIRPYVGHKALHGQEPVGWALGYLLGDLDLSRYLVTEWGLGDWICLPEATAYRWIFDIRSWRELFQPENLGAANLRLLICIYCLSIILAGLTVVFRLSSVVDVDTRRKVFHGMMVVMFLPTTFVDPTFVSLALILILAVFLLLDLFRASQLPPISKPLTYFLAPYVDGRDHRGPVIVSHIFLLIGCAIPLWLSLAAVERKGDTPWEGWDVSRRDLSMVSGIVCVGMGDAAASLIGRRYGRRRWCWSGGKSFEGSFAFAVAVVFGLSFARLWLLLGGWDGDSGDSWATTLGKACIAATGASLTEAVLTGGNDNVIVPIILWLLVRGLRI
ncbi:hypothetical protein IMSHALPRED_002648 [Imshaugia aleurites]|uniref:dolichol kinase n=1 Tax=Imshaugia aleurites TaxID=172621 RepID=A0A8H3IH80_9LECA|nr:hypothetical protein IMSHALPRED_002648 [Imshaugia aleurites]